MDKVDTKMETACRDPTILQETGEFPNGQVLDRISTNYDKQINTSLKSHFYPPVKEKRVAHAMLITIYHIWLKHLNLGWLL